ncbi:MAG: caspase family protein [Spirochaetales bacterium]|nr:caspase family protein [Spirochaetales bacterium]
MKAIIIFLIIFLPVNVLYADTRGLKDVEKKLNQRIVLGRQYLLLIASDRYEHWPHLKNPVSDAKEIKRVITLRYYIDEVIELYNEEATKANILKTFGDLQKRLEINDSLLIYYAGHGYYDNEITKTGFWIPTNGGLDKHEQDNWIPNSQIRGMISNFKASHILLISDSCFSGDILSTMRGSEHMDTVLDTIKDRQVITTYNLTSRQVITSGASEFVPDNSEFALQLKMTLEKNNNPYLDPFTLYSHIKKGIHSTLPLLGCLNGTGHQDGASFYLFLKDAPEGGDTTTLSDQPDSIGRDTDSGVKKACILLERLSLNLFAGYSAPVINEIAENLSPSFFLDFLIWYRILDIQTIHVSLLFGGLFTWHAKAPGFPDKNNLLLTGPAGGISMGFTFPFYRMMGIFLNVLGGYGISIAESGSYDRTVSSFGDPVVLGQMEVKYTVEKYLIISVKGSYMVVFYTGENNMWLHEICGGIGIGYAF